VARSRWSTRLAANSSEGSGSAGQQATREARWCPREEVGGVNRRQELEEGRAHSGGGQVRWRCAPVRGG
jgi:hypothetical protein